MRRFTKLLTTLSTGLMMFSTQSLSAPNTLAQSDTVSLLKFGYSEFAPYTFTDDQGRPSGEVTNIIENIVAESGHEFLAVDGPNRRLFRSLVSDDIDLLMVVPFKNDQSHQLLFGDKVFDTLVMSIFWFEGNASPIMELEELKGRPLISIAGYSYGGIFREEGLLEGVSPFYSESHPNAIKALVQQRAPYLLAYEKPVLFYLDESVKANLRSYSIKTIPLVLSIRRSYPDAERVLKDLELRYEALYPERFKALNSKSPAEK